MTETDLLVLLTVLGTSFLTCAVLVATQRWHGRFSLDHQLQGAQKFHAVPVPRVGGLAWMVSLSAAALVALLVSEDSAALLPVLLLCALPAFAAGLVEDLTKRVSVLARLCATFVSAGLAIWMTGSFLTNVDTAGLDDLLVYTPVAVLFTCFAVGGVAHAVNIIDGFNGLAAGSMALMLAGLAGLAWWAGDTVVLTLCLCGIMASLGFLAVNYPFGKIFLGDGGAYMAGFWLGECAVLLLARNPEVSTWAVLLCCIYPVFETIFSIWRKDLYRKTGSGKPDKVHFHMLVYRRLVSQKVGAGRPGWVKHGLTTLLIWLLVAMCQLAVWSMVLLKQSNWGYAAGVLAFAILYVLLYRKMVLGCYPAQGPDGTHALST